MTPTELDLLLLSMPTSQLLDTLITSPDLRTYAAIKMIHTPEDIREWLPLIHMAPTSKDLFVTRVGIALRLTATAAICDSFRFTKPETWNVWGFPQYTYSRARFALDNYYRGNLSDARGYCAWLLDQRVFAVEFLAADPALLPPRYKEH